MTGPADPELQAWRDDWQDTAATPLDPPEAVRRHVRRRSRLLKAWTAAEGVLATAALALLGVRAVTHHDAVERTAMSALAIVVLAAALFALWNWWGTWHAPTETTARFLDLSFERCRRLRRAVRFGWIVLAAETVVFVPWIWYQTRASSRAVWAWAFLAAMLAFGALLLAGLARWERRESHALERLAAETRSEG